jgi:oligopeptide transport system substrate-binding protein
MRLICLLMLLVLASCGKVGHRERNDERAIIRLSDADARGLDPQLVSDLSSIRIAADQFEGLTRFNGFGEAEPGLAESWQVSGDGKTWRFRLLPGLRFSDGVAIGAPVFAKALNRIQHAKTGSPHSELFGVIGAIEAPDDRTAIVRLHNPFPQLPALLAHPAMAALPFHLIETDPGDWTAKRPLVTSGPYRLTQWRLNQQMTLSANSTWHGSKPAAQRIIWRPMDNQHSGMRSVLAGAADTGSDFPASRLAWLRARYPGIARSDPYLATYYFAFNTRRPPFDDVRVRRALAMAIDRQWMTDRMIAAGNEPAFGLLPPALRQSDALVPAWALWPRTRRLAEAKALLQAAGYSDARPLAFEIRFNSSSEHRRAAAAMATMWRALGVQASLLNSEASLHFDSLKRGDFALARSGWVADLPAPENFLSVHRAAAGPQNYSGYDSPAYNRALDAALAERNEAQRAAKMRIAEGILIEDMPILPLYFYVSRALVRPDVSGWHANISNIHPSYTLAKKRS